VSHKRQGASPLAPRTINRHLNLLHLLFEAAGEEELIRSNPVSKKLRAREPRRRWTILSPMEIGRVGCAFVELVEQVEGVERTWREQARVVFLTVVSAGLRRGEILGLRWRDVALADPAGATLRVRETWVRGATDTPKSEKSERTIALGERLAYELFDHRARTAYQGDDERVFANRSPAGRSTRRVTPRRSSLRSSGPRSTGRCARSTTAGTRRSRTRPRQESRRRR
jgi:integrase